MQGQGELGLEVKPKLELVLEKVLELRLEAGRSKVQKASQSDGRELLPQSAKRDLQRLETDRSR